MMLRRLGWYVALCLVMFTRMTSAQNDAPDTFPVEQRCISEPTQPPDGWTYPGMILMSGYAGIHAMQADWDTPRVVASFSWDQNGNQPVDGGQLSPDEDWYAAPIGKVVTDGNTYNKFWFEHGLRVYSLNGDGKMLYFSFDEIAGYHYILFAWGYLPIEWQNDETLVIDGMLWHPFENRVEPAQVNISDIIALYNQRIFSPDRTRAYGGITPWTDNRGLNDFVSLRTITDLGRLGDVSWQSDSAGFAAELQEEDQDWHGLAYFDRDGTLIDHILQYDSDAQGTQRNVSGRSELQWSPNDRYFAFVINTYPDPKKLMLVDWQDRSVIDTCVTPLNAPVWSPDGTMFAYLANARENLNLIVVDTTTWQAYIVARHSGALGLFGEPEMVGWRSAAE